MIKTVNQGKDCKELVESVSETKKSLLKIKIKDWFRNINGWETKQRYKQKLSGIIKIVLQT